MAKKFSNLRSQMSHEAQAKAQAKAVAMLEEMTLHELPIMDTDRPMP
ncbi:hypothetical protein L3556_13915 [Candidatus Synechococcus calcipolaris G9]|uniref:Uncharacterized protein n=1 Tax=Candidatus Synechococcus calcipolaris G9 TaxID=1497997 RepID=A0ABT6F2H3_9SYNE|nr:hypothetical protein [Candidatus Synechococcus calcipolaris]MDG2992017.1 hypothetical protein [Candidatus Synechococcus calcipolaris G9]